MSDRQPASWVKIVRTVHSVYRNVGIVDTIHLDVRRAVSVAQDIHFGGPGALHEAVISTTITTLRRFADV